MNSKEKFPVDVVKQVSNSDLNPDIKDHVITTYMNSTSDQEDAFMDKVFGKRNPQMYVALTMSILVLLVVVLMTIIFKENLDFVKFIWNIAVPAITLLWGYAFGKNKSDS